MEHIVCLISYLPLRSEPMHNSEQVSQILFGEYADIIEKKGNWIRIQTHNDKYIGWVEEKTIEHVSDTELKNYISKPKKCICRLNLRVYNSENNAINLPLGTELPVYQDYVKNFSIFDRDFYFRDPIDLSKHVNLSDILNLANELLSTPYIWGGKTQWGTDCSGLTQILLKCLNIQLPRDTKDQINLGEKINSLEHAIAGDLAFFTENSDKVSHVGILTGSDKIIHASGKVREDILDQNGIYNKSNGKYTHKLIAIKRLI